MFATSNIVGPWASSAKKRTNVPDDSKFILLLSESGIPHMLDLNNDAEFDNDRFSFDQRVKVSVGQFAHLIRGENTVSLQVLERGSKEVVLKAFNEKYCDFRTQDSQNVTQIQDNSTLDVSQVNARGKLNNDDDEAAFAQPPRKQRKLARGILEVTSEEDDDADMLIKNVTTGEETNVNELPQQSSMNKTAKLLATEIFGEEYMATHRFADATSKRMKERAPTARADIAIFDAAMCVLYPEAIGSLPAGPKRESLTSIRRSVSQAGKDLTRPTPDLALLAFLASKNQKQLFNEFKLWRMGKTRDECAAMLQ